LPWSENNLQAVRQLQNYSNNSNNPATRCEHGHWCPVNLVECAFIAVSEAIEGFGGGVNRKTYEWTQISRFLSRSSRANTHKAQER